jgi:Protein of unknown function (DUF2783)
VKSDLNTEPNFGIPGQSYRYSHMPGDDFYEMLLDGHQGLNDAQSELMNARLVLLLANHIGDLRVLGQAIAAARAGIDGGAEPGHANGEGKQP